MKLKIDTAFCDIASDTHLDIQYDADRLRSLESAREGDTQKLTLAHTKNNDQLFGLMPDFNALSHTAELTIDGATLYKGWARLLAISDKGYTVEIRSGAAQWAKNASLGSFSDIALDFFGHLTPTDMYAGWSDTRPIKFLPILRDNYEQQNNATDLQPVLQLLSPDDYHPFLQIDALVRAIFTRAGYTIESRFMQSELFRSLYMSGAYASRDTAAAEKRMGFRAVRMTTKTATADAIGRVYATPYGADEAVGNIVETATPLSVDENGVVHTEPYNNGNCFGLEERKIVYRPTSTINVGFEYHLRYTTDHRILTRERLTGFDTLNLGTGGNLYFHLPNRYTDRRNDLTANRTYRVVVFGGSAGVQYRLSYLYNGAASVVWCEFTGRTALVTTPPSGVMINPALYVRTNNVWSLYKEDWALYDGYIGETGETTVELTLHTPAETTGPSTPKYFNTIFFAGANEGMQLTLHPSCSLRPLFSPAPAYGARISAADVMHHNIRQQVVLEAIQHLFNLRFYTDETLKKVFIEPAADFWDEAHEADWRGRTDLSQPIVWRDTVLDVHDSRTYGYRTGDGASDRLGQQEGESFGSWQTKTNSYAAIEGDEKRISPLFCPTLSISGGSMEAPSALLMQVGNRDDLTGDGINFTPRIVCYNGLHPLPSGERWNDSSGGKSYPFAAFHFAGDSTQPGGTLCFGDRDGLTGLHRYYDREEAINASRCRITLTLQIEPHEFESLFAIGSGAPDLRWVFRISTDKEDLRATLHHIGEYDPVRATIRCTFTQLSHD